MCVQCPNLGLSFQFAVNWSDIICVILTGANYRIIRTVFLCARISITFIGAETVVATIIVFMSW